MARVIRYSVDSPDGLGLIAADNGYTFQYRLQKQRVWNVGLRRHLMERTGRLILLHPLSGGYNVFDDWESMCLYCEAQSGLIAKFDEDRERVGATRYPRIDPVAE